MKSIKDLVEQEADLHADEDGALRSAAAYGRLKVIKYLLGQGADLQVWDDRPFRKAAEFGHPEAAKRSAEQGADLQAWNDYSLRKAAEFGQLEVVKHLIEQGDNLHAKNDYGLRWDANNGHLEVVKCLLERGADSDRLSRRFLIKLFTSYDLQTEKITPRLFSLLLKINFVKKPYKMSTRNKILSTYKKKVVSSLIILMYHLYYRPSGPGFFQAIEQI